MDTEEYPSSEEIAQNSDHRVWEEYLQGFPGEKGVYSIADPGRDKYGKPLPEDKENRLTLLNYVFPVAALIFFISTLGGREQVIRRATELLNALKGLKDVSVRYARDLRLTGNSILEDSKSMLRFVVINGAKYAGKFGYMLCVVFCLSRNMCC